MISSFIESTLQAYLTTYKATNITTLEYVKIQDIYSDDPKIANEPILVQGTLRELPSVPTKSNFTDRTATFDIKLTCVQNERTAILYIMNQFFNDYHGTHISSDVDGVLRVVPAVPYGKPENIGAYTYQTWAISIVFVLDGVLTTISDRSITYGANVLTSENGLISARLTRKLVYAEYPSSSSGAGVKPRYYVPELMFSMYDAENTVCGAFKALIYGSTNSITITYESGLESITFTGYLILAEDSINEQGFPVLTFQIQKG